MRKWLHRVLIGIGLLALLFRPGNWSARHGHSLPALPQPNGYDELLAAANLVKPPPSDLIELTADQIRSLADQNRPAIEQARKAFAMESRVSIKPTQAWDDHHEEELKLLKRLAVAFSVEARNQLLDHHTNDSAHCDLDALRLAESMRCGGITIDGINSLTVEVIGSAMLQAKLPQLDAAFCRDAAAEIEALSAHRELPDAIFATERTWSRLRYGIVDVAGGFIMKSDMVKREAKYRERSREIDQREQRLMLRLAARAYELDNRQPPANVSALVPTYLKAMPRNLETAKEIQEVPPPLP